MSTVQVWARFSVVLAIASALFHGAVHAQPAEKPPLLIETGRHSAPITDISASRDGSFFATSSRDKTVRIWNAAGRQVNVIRPPVGGRSNDAVVSVALSPDGNTVAYQFTRLDQLEERGQFFLTFPIQVLNLRTQKTESLGRTFEPVKLGFSPDGRYLGWITAFPAEGALKVDIRRTSDWELYARAHRTTSETRSPATFDFSPDGNRIAITHGNQVSVHAINGSSYSSRQLFDASRCKDDNQYCRVLAEDAASLKRMSMERTLKPVHGKSTYGGRWSPDGRWLAFGYLDTPSVTLVSLGKWGQVELPATNLERAYFNGPSTMAILTWSVDSKKLLSTGTMGAQFIKPTVIREWTVGAKSTYVDHESTTGRDTKLSVDGIVPTSTGYAFASNDSIGFFESESFRVLTPSSGLRRNLSLYNNLEGTAFFFRFNRTGDLLGSQYVFDVLKRELRPEERELPASFGPLEKPPGMENFGLRSDNPILNGVRLEIDSRSGAFAFAPDGETLLIGTRFALYRFDRNGAKIWSVELPAGAQAMNTSRDGRLVLVVLDDGTLRWYRLLDGKPVLAFFVLNDQRSWALWTPEGYFDTSEGANAVLHMAVRRSNGLIEAEPLSSSSPMRRPDKVDEALLKFQIIGEAVPIPRAP